MKLRDIIFFAIVAGVVYVLVRGHPVMIGDSSQVAISIAADDFSKRFGILPQAVEICSVQAMNGGFHIRLASRLANLCADYKTDQFGKVMLLNG